jgi:hypothetical protein
MISVNAVGIDPGPIPGVVALQFLDGRLVHVDVLQCNAFIAPALINTLLFTLSAERHKTVVQIERFVVGRRASRSSTPAAGQQTRDLVGGLEQVCHDLGITPAQRSAAAVKPWATDARLERAGLLDATKGMRHAKDAARHALYTAVKNGAMPDPLSKEWRSHDVVR